LFFETGYTYDSNDGMTVNNVIIPFDFSDIVAPDPVLPWGNIVLYTFLSLLASFIILFTLFIYLICRFKNKS
jgi:hypothetical protein